MLPNELIDIENIKRLKSRYFRFLDTKQWVAWRSLFTDDCEFPDGRHPSADALVAWLASERETAITVHHGHTPEIALTGPDTARGIWAMNDYVEFDAPAASGPAKGYRGFVGAGHYEEEYRKIGDEWKISSMRLTRLRIIGLTDPPTPRLEGYAASGGNSWIPYEHAHTHF
jgi:hypothetical protein